MNDQFFADGIVGIHVTGLVVRIDFATLSASEREANGQPKLEFTRRVVMPIDAFLRAAAKMQEAAQAFAKASAEAQQKHSIAQNSAAAFGTESAIEPSNVVPPPAKPFP